MPKQDDFSSWNPGVGAAEALSVWDLKPEDRAFTGGRPQKYIVEPPEGVGATDSLLVISQVRGVNLIAPAMLDRKSLFVVPPEEPEGTSIEVLTELGLILTDLAREEVVDLVEKGYRISRNDVRYIPPIDPLAREKNKENGGFEDSDRFTWGLQAIGVPEARFTGEGIKVAVLDTGCDPKHPDFFGRISNGNVISFVLGETAVDKNGHGTHVCGTIAGPFSPQSGPRYGVAPDCELLVAKVLSNSGSGYDSWILKGINWAASMGAVVINLSLGSKRSKGEEPSFEYEALARRLLRTESPSLIVAAAGNDSARPPNVAPVGSPAACESILAVAAIDQEKRVAAFSCGQVDACRLNLSGPGVQVLSAKLGGDLVPEDGTSMAAPHVSGAAALWAESDSALRGVQLWDKLVAKAGPLNDPVTDVGGGLVQTP